MNAVEIEEALSDLAGSSFNEKEFPFQFLWAFGAKEVTLAKLRSGNSNSSDLENGLLQRNNIHIAVAPRGDVSKTLAALRQSPKTKAGKVKFILATDGVMLEAENLQSGEPLVLFRALRRKISARRRTEVSSSPVHSPVTRRRPTHDCAGRPHGTNSDLAIPAKVIVPRLNSNEFAQSNGTV
jgi:hypothetical protein